MTSAATSGPPHASTCMVVGPRGRGKTMLLARVAAETAQQRGLSPDRCCRSGSWKRARRSSASPTSGWRPCSIWPTRLTSTTPSWPGSCATPGTRWRRAGGSRSPRGTPAPPCWMPRTDWASSSCSSWRPCSHFSVTSTTTSAGNSAKSFRRNRRSSCWAPPPAASANSTM